MRTLLLAGLACSAALPAAHADAATRAFSVVSFDRIRVEGPFHVTLSTGMAPFASASGSDQGINSVSIDVQGRTLIVRGNPASWGGYPGAGAGPVEVSVGTHELTAAWLNGSGTLAIDAVKAMQFELAVQGSGSASIDRLDVDVLKFGMSGAASARLGGRAARTTVIVRGSSSLDASQLEAKDAVVGADGPALVKLRVTNSAKVDALGTSSVALDGGAACTVKTIGSATVTGCR